MTTGAFSINASNPYTVRASVEASFPTLRFRNKSKQWQTKMQTVA